MEGDPKLVINMMHKCLKCGNWYGAPRYTEDIIHQCRETKRADSDRLQRRQPKHHQGTRQTIKWDEEWWHEMGSNPHMPKGQMTYSRFKKQAKELTNVDWYQKVR